MLNDFVPEHMASFEIPISALSGGPQCIFIETSPIPPRASGIAFRKIRTDRADGTEELIAEGYCSPTLPKSCGVTPSQVGEE